MEHKEPKQSYAGTIVRRMFNDEELAAFNKRYRENYAADWKQEPKPVTEEDRLMSQDYVAGMRNREIAKKWGTTISRVEGSIKRVALDLLRNQ